MVVQLGLGLVDVAAGALEIAGGLGQGDLGAVDLGRQRLPQPGQLAERVVARPGAQRRGQCLGDPAEPPDRVGQRRRGTLQARLGTRDTRVGRRQRRVILLLGALEGVGDRRDLGAELLGGGDPLQPPLVLRRPVVQLLLVRAHAVHDHVEVGGRGLRRLDHPLGLVGGAGVLLVQGLEVAVEPLDLAPALAPGQQLLVLFDQPADGRLPHGNAHGVHAVGGEHRGEGPCPGRRDHRVGIEQLGDVDPGVAAQQVGGLAVDAVTPDPQRREDGRGFGGGLQRGERVLGHTAHAQGVEQVGLAVAVRLRARHDQVQVGLVAVALQNGVLVLAGLRQQRIGVGILGLVQGLFGGQDGFVGRLDLRTGAGHELTLAPGRLDVDDGPLDVVQPMLCGRKLLGRGR